MGFKEECGVFGVYNHKEASRLAYLGLFGLQHRGQESAGIVTNDNGIHYHYKNLGLVNDVFNEKILDELKGSIAIGHVRYSTTGQNSILNAQPLYAKTKWGEIAIGHNGNLVNTDELRKELEKDGAIFQGTNDTECILHLLAKNNEPDFIKNLKECLVRLKGAYSFVILFKETLIAIRDPHGFRPLALGELKGATVISSESCAFDLIEAKFKREIKPGEIFWIDKTGEHSEIFQKVSEEKKCIFELVYFSRPDSVIFNQSVYYSRKLAGSILAKEDNISADLVVPVPDSGVPAAIGYAQESKIPFELAIIRNHYIGRTFIEPKSSIRSFGVKIKLNPQSAVLKDKKVIVIDDSIIRGTTSKKIIGLIRAAGAKEVHLRIAAPPTTGPCLYGIDTPTKEELIASHNSIEEIRKFIGADSLKYLSLEGLYKSTGSNKGFCSACFDGKYPVL